MKTMSVVDTISGVYIGLRAFEPMFKVAKGEWNMEGAMNELKYRFGFYGSEGFNPWGSLETYLPVVGMQIGKRILKYLGLRSFKLGPFRVP